MAEKKGSSNEKNLFCSFCGKSQHEVKKLIAGPSVFVCDECIDLCNEIIRDDSAGVTDAKEARGDLPTPATIKANLDKIIWSAIFIPGALVLVGSWRAGRKRLG